MRIHSSSFLGFGSYETRAIQVIWYSAADSVGDILCFGILRVGLVGREGLEGKCEGSEERSSTNWESVQ